MGHFLEKQRIRFVTGTMMFWFSLSVLSKEAFAAQKCSFPMQPYAVFQCRRLVQWFVFYFVSAMNPHSFHPHQNLVSPLNLAINTSKTTVPSILHLAETSEVPHTDSALWFSHFCRFSVLRCIRGHSKLQSPTQGKSTSMLCECGTPTKCS